MDLDALWRAHAVPLTRFVQRRGADAAVADDIMAEAFARLARSHLETPEAARAWLYRTAERLATDHHRKHRPVSGLPHELASEEMDPVEVARAELAACLPAFIARLPAPYREAVQWSEIDGLTQQAVAMRQGVSLSGAKSRVQRGRAKLAEMYRRCCRFEHDHRGSVMDYALRGKRC